MIEDFIDLSKSQGSCNRKMYIILTKNLRNDYYNKSKCIKMCFFFVLGVHTYVHIFFTDKRRNKEKKVEFFIAYVIASHLYLHQFRQQLLRPKGQI